MSPRRWLVAGALLTVLGLGIAATAPIVGTAGAEGARERVREDLGLKPGRRDQIEAAGGGHGGFIAGITPGSRA